METHEKNTLHIINVCKKIRKLAKLEQFKLDTSDFSDSENLHLFRYLDYCHVSKEGFVKGYLSNLQPYMISRTQTGSYNAVCVLDEIHHVFLIIKLDEAQSGKMIVSYHKCPMADVVKNHICLKVNGTDKVQVLADCITGGITNTNTKTIDILIPCGIINIPVSLVGELQPDGTFLVSKNSLGKAMFDVCDDYIKELYTSTLDIDALDNVKIFSSLQQVPYTLKGNTVFSNISLLVDNMTASLNPLHTQSAGFALMTYINSLIMTADQKTELINLIHEKYFVSSQKGIEDVTNMLIDIIQDVHAETYIMNE